MPRTILVWFKNDLRLRDNETWYRACQHGDRVIPLYVFDPRQFGLHKLGFPRTGSFRAQFLIESVTALREKLRATGSDLIVKIGLPEFVMPEICTENQVSDVFTRSEITDEEIRISSVVAHSLALKNIAFTTFETTTLLHPTNLPFEIAESCLINLPLFEKQ
jgi:deoxyribodipyrimidine photo-lyase